MNKIEKNIYNTQLHPDSAKIDPSVQNEIDSINTELKNLLK